jgi:outer membrane protein assembly factor BamE (lipoprotein component of BamABCDE complex)
MHQSLLRPIQASSVKASRIGLLTLLLLLGGTSACVTENTTTGEMVPRGKQRYPWDKVVELAKQLQKGMNKPQVLALMGSPAEIDADDNQWVYLPERYGILVPAQALRLEFDKALLTDFGYRAIVLGAQL